MTMAARWRKLTSPTSLLTREGRARRRFNCGKQAEWDERASTAIALLADTREVWEGETESPDSHRNEGKSTTGMQQCWCRSNRKSATDLADFNGSRSLTLLS